MGTDRRPLAKPAFGEASAQQKSSTGAGHRLNHSAEGSDCLWLLSDQKSSAKPLESVCSVFYNL